MKQLPFSPKSFNTRQRRKAGFTLVEILLVIALIALLAGFLIVNAGNIFGSNQQEIAKTWVNTTIKTPLFAYMANMGSYPSTEEGLKALKTAPEGKATRWKGPYIEGSMPNDPWGNPYQYKYPGERNKQGYDVWSMGPDGQSGTADDIGNWEAEETK